MIKILTNMLNLEISTDYIITNAQNLYCILCDVDIIGIHMIKSHVQDQQHQSNVTIHANNHITLAGKIYYCNYCRLSLEPKYVSEHIQGKKHVQNMSYQRGLAANTNGAYPGCQMTPVDFIIEEDDTLFYCVICKCDLNGYTSFTSHLHGRRHTGVLEEYGCNQFFPLGGSSYYCQCCACTLSGVKNVADHAKGSRHSKAIENLNSQKESYDTSKDLSNVFDQGGNSFGNNTPVQGQNHNNTLQQNGYKSNIVNELVSQNSTIDFIVEYDDQNYECLICECNLSGPSSVTSHQNGRRHAATLTDYGCDEISPMDDTRYYCNCCDCTISGLDNVVLHAKGSRHTSALEELESESDEISSDDENVVENSSQGDDGLEIDFIVEYDDDTFRCILCECTLLNASSTTDHRNGRRHAASLTDYGCDQVSHMNKSKYYCNLCDCTILGVDNVALHVKGFRHTTALEKCNNQEDEISKRSRRQSEDSTQSSSYGYLQERDYDFGINARVWGEQYKNTSEQNGVKQNIQLQLASQNAPIDFIVEDDDMAHDCLICNCKLYDDTFVTSHRNGRRHTSALAENGCDHISQTDETNYYCKCCDCRIPGLENAALHAKGSRHSRVLDELKNLQDRSNNQNVANIESGRQSYDSIQKPTSYVFHQGDANSDINTHVQGEQDKSTLKQNGFKENSPKKAESQISTVNFIVEYDDACYDCIICDCKFSGSSSLKSHINGRRHANALLTHGCDHISPRSGGNYYCKCCDCVILGLDNVALHAKGWRHSKALEKLNSQKTELRSEDVVEMQELIQNIQKLIRDLEISTSQNKQQKNIPNVSHHSPIPTSRNEQQKNTPKVSHNSPIPTSENEQQKNTPKVSHNSPIPTSQNEQQKNTPKVSHHIPIPTSQNEQQKNTPKVSHNSPIPTSQNKQQENSPKASHHSPIPTSQNGLLENIPKESQESPISSEISSIQFIVTNTLWDHTCTICECKLANPSCVTIHLNGKRHTSKLESFGCDQISRTNETKYYCRCCECDISGIDNVVLHVKEQSHSKAVSALNKQKDETNVQDVVTMEPRRQSNDSSQNSSHDFTSEDGDSGIKNHVEKEHPENTLEQNGCDAISMTNEGQHYFNFSSGSLNDSEAGRSDVKNEADLSLLKKPVENCEDQNEENNIGEQKRKKIKSREKRKLKQPDDVSIKENEDLQCDYIYRKDSTNSRCAVCKVALTDESSIANHVTKTEHLCQLKKYGCDQIKLIKCNTYYCESCAVVITELKQVYKHVTDRVHVLHLNRLNTGEVQINQENTSKKGNSRLMFKQKQGIFHLNYNQICCAVCNVKNIQTSWNLHIAETNHRKSFDLFHLIFDVCAKKVTCTLCNIKMTWQVIKFHAESHSIAPWFQSVFKSFFENYTLRYSQKYYCYLCKDGFKDENTGYLHLHSETHKNLRVHQPPVNKSLTLETLGIGYLPLIENGIVPNNSTTVKCKICGDIDVPLDEICEHIETVSHSDFLRDCKEIWEHFPELKSALRKIGNTALTESEQKNILKIPRQNLMCEFNIEENTTDINSDTEGQVETSAKLDSVPAPVVTFPTPPCLFIVRQNNVNFTCYACNVNLCGLKEVNEHVVKKYHSMVMSERGCDKISPNENGNYYCEYCDDIIFKKEMIYYHIEYNRHIRNVVASKKLKPGSSQEDAEEIPIFSESEKTKQPELNAMLSFMAADLERMNPTKPGEKGGKCTKQSNRNSELLSIKADREKIKSKEPPEKINAANTQLACNICNFTAVSWSELHGHSAGHFSKDFVTSNENDKNNSEIQNNFEEDNTEENEIAESSSESSYNDLSQQTVDPLEHRFCEEQASRDNGANGDQTDDGFSDNDSMPSYVKCALNDFASSDWEDETSYVDEFDNEPRILTEEECIQSLKKKRLKKKKKLKEYSKKFKDQELEFYKLEDKLQEVELGMKFYLVTSEKSMYCVVCRVEIPKSLQSCYEHLNNLDHCDYLDDMETDRLQFEKGEFSDFDLTLEYMEDMSDDTVHCFACNNDINNDNNLLKQHINDVSHELKVSKFKAVAKQSFESVKSRIQCDWYSVQNFWCVLCSKKFQQDILFMQHLESQKHANVIKKQENTEKKNMFDFCAPCSLLWYGFRSTYSYHSDVESHTWLARDGYYLARDLPKLAKILLSKPEKCINDLMKNLDDSAAEERMKEAKALKDLLKTIKLKFPKAKAYIFGSRVSGTNLEGCDIDIFVDCANMYDKSKSSDSNALYYLTNVHECMLKNPTAWVVQEIITDCENPIIKALHKSTDLPCDISFKNGLSVENTKLIKAFNDAYPACRKLIVFLKQWRKACSLPSAISNCAIYWLVIFYLQREAIFPSITTLIEMKNKSRKIGGWEVGVTHNFACNDVPQNFTFTQHLIRFFKLYAHFDYHFDVICPLVGDVVKKSAFQFREHLPNEFKSHHNYKSFEDNAIMCIQDPFNLEDNKVSSVKKVDLNRFRTYCLKSLDILCSL